MADEAIRSKIRYTKTGRVKEYITDIQHNLAIETMVGGEKNYDKLISLYNKNLPVELQISNLDEIDTGFKLYDKGLHYERIMYDISEKKLHNLERKLYNETKEYIFRVKPYSEMLFFLFISIHNDESARSFIRYAAKHKVDMEAPRKDTNMNVMDRCLLFIDAKPYNKFQINVLYHLLAKGFRFHKYNDPFNTKDLKTEETHFVLAESFLHTSEGKEKIRNYDEKFRKVHPLEELLDESSDSSLSYSPLEIKRLGKSRRRRKHSSRKTHKAKDKKEKSSSKSSTKSKSKSPSHRHRRVTRRRRKQVIVDSSDSE